MAHIPHWQCMIGPLLGAVAIAFVIHGTSEWMGWPTWIDYLLPVLVFVAGVALVRYLRHH